MYPDEPLHGLLVCYHRVRDVLHLGHRVPVHHLAVEGLEPAEAHAVHHGAAVGEEGHVAHLEKSADVVVPVEKEGKISERQGKLFGMSVNYLYVVFFFV